MRAVSPARYASARTSGVAHVAQIAQRESERVQLVCLVTLTLIAGAAALHWLEPVMVPLVLAVLLSYCLSPVVELAERRAGLPHGVAVMTALVVASSALLLLVAVVTLAAHDIVGKAKQYEAYVIALSNRAAAAHKSAAATLASSKLASKVMERSAGELLTDSMSEFSLGSVVVNATHRLLASFAEWLSNALLVIIFVIYLLEGQRKRSQPRRGGLVARIQGRIQKYMTIKLVLSLANGFLAWGTYRLLRLDLAVAFGFIHFVLNFIPSVGPLVATLIPLPVVLVDPKLQAMEVLLTIALPTVTHLFIGHYVEPKLMGESLELHPITVLLCLIFWGMIWGVPGMLLAAPMTAASKLVFESMEVTLPLAQLLGGSLSESTEGGSGGGDDGTPRDVELGATPRAQGAAAGGGEGGLGGGSGGGHKGEGGGVVLVGPGGALSLLTGDDLGGPVKPPGVTSPRLNGAPGGAFSHVIGGGGGGSGGLLGVLGGAARRDKSAND